VIDLFLETPLEIKLIILGGLISFLILGVNKCTKKEKNKENY